MCTRILWAVVNTQAASRTADVFPTSAHERLTVAMELAMPLLQLKCEAGNAQRSTRPEDAEIRSGKRHSVRQGSVCANGWRRGFRCGCARACNKGKKYFSGIMVAEVASRSRMLWEDCLAESASSDDSRSVLQAYQRRAQCRGA